MARKISSTEGKLTGTRDNGLLKGGGGKIKLRGEAIICKGGWAGACKMREKLSLRKVIIKAIGGEGVWIGSGIHFSQWNAIRLPPRFMKITKPRALTYECSL